MSNKVGNPVLNYFSESYQELKKVTWPTRNQAFKMTIIVLSFCLASALIIGLIDLAFNQGFQYLLNFSQTTV